MTALSLRQIYLEDKYLVMHSIGSGHFGDIRVAKELESDSFVAIKLEETDKNTKIKAEYNMYLMIKKSLPALRENNERLRETFDGFPNVYGCGVYENYNYMIMDLLGFNLETLYNVCNRRFSYKTIAMIGIQMLHRLEVLHQCDIVYRDIKPENFVIGQRPENRNIIYMVDLGLAMKYERRVEDTDSDERKVVGTCRYMSINAHLGNPQSEWDDLESVVYLLCYLSKGNLPWQGVKQDDIQYKYQRVYEIKKATSANALCRNAPSPLIEFITYVKNGSKDLIKPDYDTLHRILGNILRVANGVCDWNFDWIEKDLTNSFSYEYQRTHANGFFHNMKTGLYRCCLPIRNK